MRYILYIFILCSAFNVEAQKVYKLQDVAVSGSVIRNLDLSNENLIALPEEIKQCKNLKKLDVSYNQLMEIPFWISDFEFLEELNINGNPSLDIKKSFDALSSLSNLSTLKASHCKMFYLPVSIRKLKSLKHVEIADNQIQFLPPIFEYLQWESLDLSHNCIDTLPATLVYMNSLRELDLSYTTAAVNRHNYYLLEYLRNIQSLKLSGLKEIPQELEKLVFLEELNLSNGTFTKLPIGFSRLVNLRSIDVRACEDLLISDLIESLSGVYYTLKELKIGHAEIESLPFNMMKLKRLKKLYIENSCINGLPASFHKFKGKEIYFRNCSFSTPERVFNNLGKASKLQKIEVDNCVFGHNNWLLSGNDAVLEINFLNCGMVRVPFHPKDFEKLKSINLTGNKIPKSAITWDAPKTKIGVSYDDVKYPTVEMEQWKFSSLVPEVRRMIYSEIGDVFTLPSGSKIEIEAESFITTGNTAVKGDVEVRIKEYNLYEDIALSNFPTFLPSSAVADHQYAIEIRAYVKGKEVYLRSDKPIVVYPQLSKNIALDKYYYLAYKNAWETLSQQVDVCSKEKEVSFETDCELSTQVPEKKNNLRVSKVHLRIKRNKRRNTLNFEIEPEYGYLENQINLFGDKIKGYPELKNYKGVKWKYVGDSLENDLVNLYFLSESAKKEKINKKSTFYFYVLDIKDIRVFPNPHDDNYLLQFIQGRDTFSIEALPMMPVLKAHKIQRWHRKRYKKYKKALEKRKAKWAKMDSVYLGEYELFEFQLEAYRKAQVSQKYKKEESVSKIAKGQILKIYKPGLYSMAIPLLVSGTDVKKPIYYLKGKRFHPRRVLVVNHSKGTSYWTSAKEIRKEAGLYWIYIVLNNELYKGAWGSNNKVEFDKVERK